MQPHLSDLQFFVGIVALALAGLLVLASILDLRKRRKSAPFLNYFQSNLDQDQFDRHAFQAHGTTAHPGAWE